MIVSPDPNQKGVFISEKTPSQSHELEISLLVVFILSGIYIAYELLAEPAGGHPFGHSLGIVGTLLMLMTEMLYSLRKRTRLLNWAGPVRVWLSFHIFTGIVGPFLVLMHTGLQFRGLAGVSMGLTAVVVASGFVGRYLYTALPRSLAGAAASRRELINEVRIIQAELSQFQAKKSAHVNQVINELSQRHAQRPPWLTILGRSYFQRQFQRQARKAIRQLDSIEKSQRQQLERLLTRNRELARQMDMLETARRLMRFWHVLHIPFGLTLFFSVAVHVTATLYFRAGLFQ